MKQSPERSDAGGGSRYVIYGAGGIGCGIAACLQLAGFRVAVIARGQHLHAMQENGLTFRTPEGRHQLSLLAVGDPSELTWSAQDRVILTMKSQDTSDAMGPLRAAAGVAVPVICAQNGVENERIAARVFDAVYGMVVVMPTSFLRPGATDVFATPTRGLLDCGAFPSGIDRTVRSVCQDLTVAGFVSTARGRIMDYKYAKLLVNVGNAVQAVCGADALGTPDGQVLLARLQSEALACYRSAGIETVPADEFHGYARQAYRLSDIDGAGKPGGSTWQSVMRGTPTLEVDYLNGEIVLLGNLLGVPTPYNRTLQLAANAAASGSAEPRFVAPGSLVAEVEERVGMLPGIGT